MTLWHKQTISASATPRAQKATVKAERDVARQVDKKAERNNLVAKAREKTKKCRKTLNATKDSQTNSEQPNGL